ncbi:MAG TPA: SDR family oxidoreductase, partial [Anaerolineae bacterium]|nr:SDR family oxidoreductase [Anaerolineae bacterium]
EYTGSGKLRDKTAVITGGDSGIGRAVAMYFAKEGADVAILYLNEHTDAQEAQRQVQEEGRRSILVAGDIGDEAFCRQAVQRVVDEFGRIDILVNNAGEHRYRPRGIEDVTADELQRTFRTNIFSFFYMTKAALPHMRRGSAIINTTSIQAYDGNPHIIDYSSTKGAIVAFTRTLAMELAERGIRVNAVAPGPVWTPIIPSTYPPDYVAHFGQDTPMKRAGQPSELAPSYVFLASEVDSSYMTGQVLHDDGGQSTCS